MLIIRAKTGDKVLIGDDIEVVFLKAGNHNHTVGIAAPLDVPIDLDRERKPDPEE